MRMYTYSRANMNRLPAHRLQVHQALTFSISMFVMAEIQDHAIRAGEAVDDLAPLAKDSTNDCSFCDNMDMNTDGDGSSNCGGDGDGGKGQEVRTRRERRIFGNLVG